MNTLLDSVLRFHGWMLALSLCTAATAASFDCGHASSSIEKLICLDYRLSDLDSELASVYVTKQGQKAVAAELHIAQRKWLAERNRCTSFKCVRDTYIDRITALSPERGKFYAGMRKPSSKRWDYVAPDGYTLTQGFVLDDRPLTEQTDWFGSGKAVWVMLDEGRAIPREFTDRRPPYAQMYDRTIGLGASLILSSVGSSMCMTGVGDLGLQVDSSLGLQAPDQTRKLVALIREKWSNSEPIGDCFEVELGHRRALFDKSMVVESSLYWIDKELSVRFDENLWTQSSLIGRRVFLIWGSDLRAMVDPYCKTFDRECADKRFGRSLKDVSGFYH